MSLSLSITKSCLNENNNHYLSIEIERDTKKEKELSFEYVVMNHKKAIEETPCSVQPSILYVLNIKSRSDSRRKKTLVCGSIDVIYSLKKSEKLFNAFVYSSHSGKLHKSKKSYKEEQVYSINVICANCVRRSWHSYIETDKLLSSHTISFLIVEYLFHHTQYKRA